MYNRKKLTFPRRLSNSSNNNRANKKPLSNKKESTSNGELTKNAFCTNFISYGIKQKTKMHRKLIINNGREHDFIETRIYLSIKICIQNWSPYHEYQSVTSNYQYHTDGLNSIYCTQTKVIFASFH